jgi:hypothetical protein
MRRKAATISARRAKIDSSGKGISIGVSPKATQDSKEDSSFSEEKEAKDFYSCARG